MDTIKRAAEYIRAAIKMQKSCIKGREVKDDEKAVIDKHIAEGVEIIKLLEPLSESLKPSQAITNWSKGTAKAMSNYNPPKNPPIS